MRKQTNSTDFFSINHRQNPSSDTPLSAQFKKRRKSGLLLFFVLSVFMIVLAIFGITTGAFQIDLSDISRFLTGDAPKSHEIVIRNIRAPRIVAAIMAGWGLALSGILIQTLLRNPLGSPFTLGISQGAAFGASFSIVILGAGSMKNSALYSASTNMMSITGTYTIIVFAFLGAISATGIILLLARIKKLTAESIILGGIALSSLFTSGTILIQFFATEVEIATVVFWTFGDVARSGWNEIAIMTIAVIGVTFYILINRWNLSVFITGEDVAKSLGVKVDRLRLLGMFLATIIAAFITAFHGVIAFLGLLAPHIAKRLVGNDTRLVIPFTCLIGSILLLLADTIGRLLIGSGSLPVGVLTSFMGAPLFLYLLIKGYQK